MSNFYNNLLVHADIDGLLAHGADTPWQRVSDRLDSENLEARDVAQLIADDADDHLEEVARAAKRVRAKRFGNAIKIYAPLYLSNACVNSCRYCGFKHDNDIERTTLSVGEAIGEADLLIGQGHRHLLLVAGEDAKAVPPAGLEEIARAIRPRVASLAIEVGPQNEEAYRRIADAGIDGVTLYQETYQPDVYREMHPAGPKADFVHRLACIEAAGRAGMRFLGIGALLGLADWRRDAMALYLHARYLQRRFWQAQITVSLPRLRFVPQGFTPPHSISNRDLVRLVTVLRCALPDVGIVVSTREPADLRNNLLPLGITQMSAGSRTEPGGYAHPDAAGEQFAIEDTRSPDEVAASIAAAGFDPVFKDWERELYGGFNG